MEENLETMQLRKDARRDFSRLGIGLLVIGIVCDLGQSLFSYLWGWLAGIVPSLAEASWMKWIVSFVPLYLIAMPVGLLLLRRVPAENLPQTKLGGKRFLELLLMCFPLMYAGNIIGNILSMLLSGGSAQNALLNYITGGDTLWTFLVVVIIAPILEEFIFRKQLIDRCGKYGEKTAILFSGLTFGLFHMNLFQFFYATGLGLIFAYVYAHTRRLRYSVIMHMVINFLGSILAPLVLSLMDLEALETMDLAFTPKTLLGLLVGMGYVFLLVGLSIAGLVLLIVKRKEFVLQPASQELPKQGRLRTVYGNVGVILFVLFCLIWIVDALV